mmetsp:Transcript_1240/g.2143  ORF Transcript_1240/g.2143 Transcript_1240/m.2143 type:complete len:223 (+) Transcript_1240:83-751(+)
MCYIVALCAFLTTIATGSRLQKGYLHTEFERDEKTYPFARLLLHYSPVFRAFRNLAVSSPSQSLDRSVTSAMLANDDSASKNGNDGAKSTDTWEEQEASRENLELLVKKRAYELVRQQFGPESRRTITALNDLVESLEAQEKLAEADSLAKEALVVSRGKLRKQDPELTRAVKNYAQLLPHKRRVFNVTKLTYGDDHYFTSRAQAGFAQAKKLLDDSDMSIR